MPQKKSKNTILLQLHHLLFHLRTLNSVIQHIHNELISWIMSSLIIIWIMNSENSLHCFSPWIFRIQPFICRAINSTHGKSMKNENYILYIVLHYHFINFYYFSFKLLVMSTWSIFTCSIFLTVFCWFSDFQRKIVVKNVIILILFCFICLFRFVSSLFVNENCLCKNIQ